MRLLKTDILVSFCELEYVQLWGEDEYDKKVDYTEIALKPLTERPICISHIIKRAGDRNGFLLISLCHENISGDLRKSRSLD